jgi:hypothetical protein
LHDQYGVQAIKNTHVVILDMSAIEKPIKKYSDVLRLYAQDFAQLPKAERAFTQTVSIYQLAQYAELSGEPGVEKILRTQGKNGSIIDWNKLLPETFGKNPVDDIAALRSIDTSSLSSEVNEKMARKIKNPKMAQEIEKLLWTQNEKYGPSVNNLPQQNSDALSKAIWRQVESSLASDVRMEKYVIENFGSFARGALNGEYSTDFTAKILEKIPYNQVSGDLVFRLYVVGDEGLTVLGKWQLKHDPKGLAKTLNSSFKAGILSQLDNAMIARLVENGLKPEVLIRGVGPIRATELGYLPKTNQTPNSSVKIGSVDSVSSVLPLTIAKKLRSGGELTSAEKDLLRQYISKGYLQSQTSFSSPEGKALLEELKGDSNPTVRKFARQQRLPPSYGDIIRDLERAQNYPYAAKRMTDSLARGIHSADSVLDALTSSDTDVKNQMLTQLNSNELFRSEVSRIVEKSGTTDHVKAFPWDPENVGDREVMGRMLKAKTDEIPLIDRRVRQLALAEFELEHKRKPTRAELNQQVKNLKTDLKIRSLYDRAKVRAERELPKFSPSTERSLRSTAEAILEPEEVRRGAVSAEFCP